MSMPTGAPSATCHGMAPDGSAMKRDLVLETAGFRWPRNILVISLIAFELRVVARLDYWTANHPRSP